MNLSRYLLALICFCVFLRPATVFAQDGQVLGSAASGALSMGLPLGVPPNPGDARMLSVAPEDVGVFVSWSSLAAPKFGGSNRTERLLAEPEVQALFQHVVACYREALAKTSSQGAQAEAVAKFGAEFIESVLAHETAIYARIDDGNLAGGLVCDLGEKASDLRMLLTTLAKLGGDQVVESTLDSLAIYGLRESPVPIQITVGNRFLILAVGSQELDNIVSRLKSNSVAPWLTAARERVSVPRLANLCYVDVAHVSEALSGSSSLPADLQEFGVSGLRSMACATGLDNEGVIVRTHFQCDQQLQDQLKRLAANLESADIAELPLDAIVSSAIKFDASAIGASVLEAIEKIEQNATEQIEREVREAVGVGLSGELLPAIGDSLQVYLSPSEGGRLLTGWTGVLSLKNRDVIEKAAERLKVRLEEEESPFRFRRREFLGETVFYLTTQRSEGRFRRNESIGCTPAWCFSGNQLIVFRIPTEYLRSAESSCQRTGPQGSNRYPTITRSRASFSWTRRL